jgi:chemotaxis protein CheZ
MNLPGQDAGAVSFPREQYEALEDAVMESARGRWFLAEYARRNRAADTMLLLDALKKLESVAAATPRPSADVEGLAAAIKEARAEIAAIHNDRLPDGGYVSADPGLFSRITSDARSAASEIVKRSMSLRVVAGGLKASTVEEEHVRAVEANAHSLETLSWSQEVLSERIAKAMGLLSHIDEALTGISGKVADRPVAEHQMPYFSRDEDLFEPAIKTPEVPAASSPGAEDEAPPPEKPRIVVIRRGKTDPLDIPLSAG